MRFFASIVGLTLLSSTACAASIEAPIVRQFNELSTLSQQAQRDAKDISRDEALTSSFKVSGDYDEIIRLESASFSPIQKRRGSHARRQDPRVTPLNQAQQLNVCEAAIPFLVNQGDFIDTMIRKRGDLRNSPLESGFIRLFQREGNALDSLLFQIYSVAPICKETVGDRAQDLQHKLKRAVKVYNPTPKGNLSGVAGIIGGLLGAGGSNGGF